MTRSGDPLNQENVDPIIYSKERFFTFDSYGNAELREFKLINWNDEVTMVLRLNNPPTIRDRQVWMIAD